MSSTTNNAYVARSMNGVISYDDGAGGTMEGGVITCNELDVPIINVNEVQPYNISTNYNLFTNATTNINIGNISAVVYMLSPIVSAMPIIAGQFNSNLAYLNNIDSQIINVSTINVSNVNVGTITVGTENITTLNASVGNISTLNVSSLITDTITATTTASNVVLYNNVSTGSVKLGGDASSVIIGTNSPLISFGANTSSTSIINVGTFQFTGDTMNLTDLGAPNVSGIMRIATTLTAGSIRMGTEITSGNIIIGSHNMSGTNEIRTGGTLQLGNQATTLNMGASASTINTITIGNVSSTTNITGSTLNMGTGTIGNINIGQNTTTGLIILGNNTMTGDIVLRTTNNLLLGNSASIIEIGTASSRINTLTFGNISSSITTNASTTNISSKSLTLGASASNISMGTTNTAGVINIGVYTAGIGGNLTLSGGNVNVSAGNINIGSTAANTNTISVGNVSTAYLTLNTPINPNYDAKYTAFAGTPTDCIGNYVFPNITIGNFDLTSTTNKVGATFTNLPVGVWLLYWNAYFFVPTTNAVITSIALNMGESSGGAELLATVVECATITLAVGRTKSYSLTQIYTNVSSAQDIYFSTTATFTGTLRILGLFSGSNCKAVRLS